MCLVATLNSHRCVVGKRVLRCFHDRKILRGRTAAIPPDHPYYAYVGAIEREIARMAAITRQLYETYRPDGDGREEASIPVLISDAVTMLQHVNRRTQIRIDVDTSGAPPVLPFPARCCARRCTIWCGTRGRVPSEGNRVGAGLARGPYLVALGEP
jgi:hypothetical protein